MVLGIRHRSERGRAASVWYKTGQFDLLAQRIYESELSAEKRGGTVRDLATEIGISVPTYYSWMKNIPLQNRLRALREKRLEQDAHETAYYCTFVFERFLRSIESQCVAYAAAQLGVDGAHVRMWVDDGKALQEAHNGQD